MQKNAPENPGRECQRGLRAFDCYKNYIRTPDSEAEKYPARKTRNGIVSADSALVIVKKTYPDSGQRGRKKSRPGKPRTGLSARTPRM